MELSQHYVRTVLDYDPETGVFTWRYRSWDLFLTKAAHNAWNARFAGYPAGNTHKTRGYVEIKLLGTMHKAHRLVFLWKYGYMPEFVDHINGVRDYNALANLRDATKQENGRNQKRPAHNTSGVIGVNWHKRDRKWRAYIKVDGKNVSLGFFTDFEAAVAARKAAERSIGYHPNHGRAA